MPSFLVPGYSEQAAAQLSLPEDLNRFTKFL